MLTGKIREEVPAPVKGKDTLLWRGRDEPGAPSVPSDPKASAFMPSTPDPTEGDTPLAGPSPAEPMSMGGWRRSAD